MATREATFKETDHPLVQRIWKMLEEEIPAEFVEATNIVTSTRYQKSAAEATELRRLGNDSFLETNIFDAIMYFSKSVATAPDNSEELALAYDDRSEMLWCRELYDLCLLDANRALALPLPPSTRKMCLKRRAAVRQKLIEQKLRQMKWRAGQEDELDAYDRIALYLSKVGAHDVDLAIDHSRMDDPIWNTAADNTIPEYFSPKIVLRIDAEVGPHLIAIEDIEPGEILYVDELYSCFLYEHLKFEYCDYCHYRCDALIPCSDCTWDLYCSVACREKAYDSYHRIECQVLPSWSDIDEVRRGMRILLLRTFLRVTKQGSELANLMNSSVVCEALDGTLDCADVPFSPENHPIFAGLVAKLRYSDHSNMTCDPMMIEETLAVFAGLRSIHFFGNEAREIQGSGNVLNAQEYFGIMLLVYQISLVMPHFHGLGVYLVDSLNKSVVGMNRSVGFGFGLKQCLTLHSCDPNAFKIVNKRHVLLYSVRPIRAGEQICPLGRAEYTLHSREVRKDLYKEFGCPECTCQTCVENWPVLTEFEHASERYRTTSEPIIQRIEREREWLLRNCMGSIQGTDLRRIIKFLRTIREYVEVPSVTVVLCELYVKRYMLSKETILCLRISNM